MGDRKCAFEGCNALEFRTSGYCLRHKGSSTDEENPVIASRDLEDPEPARDNSLLIPMIVVGFVVLVSSIGGWSLLVDSACLGLVFLPLYAVYLVSRFKDGALNEVDAVLHIVSFIVLLGFCVLAMTVAGMGSPA